MILWTSYINVAKETKSNLQTSLRMTQNSDTLESVSDEENNRELLPPDDNDNLNCQTSTSKNQTSFIAK